MDLLETFEVEHGDGRRQLAHKYGAPVSHAPNAGPRATLTGEWLFELDDGRHLNPTADPGVFKIFENGKLVRRVGDRRRRLRGRGRALDWRGTSRDAEGRRGRGAGLAEGVGRPPPITISLGGALRGGPRWR